MWEYINNVGHSKRTYTGFGDVGFIVFYTIITGTCPKLLPIYICNAWIEEENWNKIA